MLFLQYAAYSGKDNTQSVYGTDSTKSSASNFIDPSALIFYTIMTPLILALIFYTYMTAHGNRTNHSVGCLTLWDPSFLLKVIFTLHNS